MYAASDSGTYRKDASNKEEKRDLGKECPKGIEKRASVEPLYAGQRHAGWATEEQSTKGLILNISLKLCGDISQVWYPSPYRLTIG